VVRKAAVNSSVWALKKTKVDQSSPKSAQNGPSKPCMQQPSFQKWGFARAMCLVLAFPLMRLLLMTGVCGQGCFRESSAKEQAKVKLHFEGSGPVSLA